VTFGQTVTIVADTSGVPPGLRILLSDGSTPLAVGQIVSTASLLPGVHTIRADYFGPFTKVTSAQTTQIVKSNPGTGFGSPQSIFTGGTPRDIQSFYVKNTGATSYVVAGVNKIFVTPSTSYAVNAIQVLVVDVNSDGISDIIALDSTTGLRVLFGNADGTFQQPSAVVNVSPTPIRMAAGDFNSDGRPDIAVVDSQQQTLSVLYGRSDGTFATPIVYGDTGNPIAIRAADVNGDGYADIVTANASIDKITVFLGTSSGALQNGVQVTVGSNLALADLFITDLNADGKLDVVTTNSGTNSVSVLLGNGNGTFQAAKAFTVGLAPKGLSVTDFNGDQKMDIVTANSGSGTVSVLLGNGDGTFQSAAGYAAGNSPVAVLPAALNNAGRVDLMVANDAAGVVNQLASTIGGCTYGLSTLTANSPAAGGSASIAVQAPLSCAYASTSNNPWISIVGNQSTFGLVSYKVDPNPNSGPRTGTMTIAGQTVTINQSGQGCAFSFSPGSIGIPVGGGSGALSVIPAGADCQWSAGSLSPWVTIDSGGSGTGTGTLNYTVASNGSSATPRVGAVSFTSNTVPAAGSLNVVQSGTGFVFYPVTPCRVFDTRPAAGFPAPFGAPTMSAGQTRTFPVPQSSCGIPPNAAAYSMNFTVQPSGYLGVLTTWPSGQSKPNTSTLNSYTGTVVANAAILPAGANGAIDVYVSDKTDVIADINGYFAPSGTPTVGLQFTPVSPCRVADTRPAAGFVGLFGAPTMTAGQTRMFPVPQSSCGIPLNASAYSFNFTVLPAGYLGLLTTWPAGPAKPNASKLKSETGNVVANAAIVPAGTNGGINVYVSDKTDVLFDVNGYFSTNPGGLNFYPVPPCRIVDTRPAAAFPPSFGAPSMALGQTRTFPIPSGGCGIPANAAAYSLNVTVAPPVRGYLGVLTTWPAGQERPNASTLNSYTGTVVANAAIVPAGTNGAISVYVSDPTDVIIDINGYFAQ
jgi:hypothetical protein